MMQHVCDAKPHVAHGSTLIYAGERRRRQFRHTFRNSRDPFMCFYCTDQRIFNMNYACVEFCRLFYTFMFGSPCCVAGHDSKRLAHV